MTPPQQTCVDYPSGIPRISYLCVLCRDQRMSTSAMSFSDSEIKNVLVRTRPMTPCFETDAFVFLEGVNLWRWRRDPCCSGDLLFYYTQNVCLLHKLVCGPLSSQKFLMAKSLSKELANSLATPILSTQNYQQEPYFSNPCAFIAVISELSVDLFWRRLVVFSLSNFMGFSPLLTI